MGAPETRHGHGSPEPHREAVPKREQFLKGDYFYPCQRCADPWPRRRLKREPVTNLLVCPNDYDMPSVQDVQNRRLLESYYQRFDRLKLNLEELP